MVYKIALGERYIPKANGNDTAEKPVAFNLKYLTVADRSEMGTFFVPVKSTKSGVQIRFEVRDAFIRCVKSIENLSVESDGMEKQIISPEDFVDLPGLDDMYTEVCLRIKETSAAEKKS